MAVTLMPVLFVRMDTLSFLNKTDIDRSYLIAALRSTMQFCIT